LESITSATLAAWLASPDALAAPPLDEVTAARADGAPVPRFGGKTIHSVYDPRGEARRLVDEFRQRHGVEAGDSVAVLGNGFGYVAEALLERDIRPVAFEPFPSLLKGFAEHRDAASLLSRYPCFRIDDPAGLHRGGPHRAHLPAVKAVLPLPYVLATLPGFAERFTRSLDAIGAASDAFFRVSVVTPLMGGSLEIARHAAAGLRACGHLVDYVDMSGFGGSLKGLKAHHEVHNRDRYALNLGSYTEWCSRLVRERVEAFDPAIVLVMAQAPVREADLRALRGQGRRVAFWFVEDSRLFPYWEAEAPHYDAFFPIQKGGFLRDLEMVGQPNAHYLPLAADEKLFRPLKLDAEARRKFGSELSFMGAGYYNRRRFLASLLGRDFKIWGNEWENAGPIERHLQEGGRRITSEESAMIFNATSVNVNLHSSTSHEGVNPFGDFVNPRTFEIAACSAFQLVDERSLLPELFRVGDEIACFADREQFLAKVDHYLARPEERAEIAAAGQARVLSEHTYRDRMRELVEALFALAPPERNRRLISVREMLAGSDDLEWRSLLSEFPEDLPLDFDLLLAGIRKMSDDRPFDRKETIISMLGGLRHGGI
jgi:spore maturation protein CgeB